MAGEPASSARPFEGRTVLVTGAGSIGEVSETVGTGHAIARAMARHGARVCVVDRDLENAERTVAAISGEGGEGIALAGDVSRAQDCEAVVAHTVSHLGGLDVLVNNVGIMDQGGSALIHEMDEDAWDRHQSINLRGMVSMSKFAIRHMLGAGGGNIISLASLAGIRAQGYAGYGAAKAGVLMVTRDIALTYGRHNIRANAIAPGHIVTPMAGGVTADPKHRDERRRAAPLGEGTAWNVADAAVFLGSDQASFITGHCLPVDGGTSEVLPVMVFSQYLA